MTNWPAVPFIRIIRGEINGKPLINKIAARTENGNFAIANLLCVKDCDGDGIYEWEEVTPVPTAALKHLQGAFRGSDMVSSLVAAVQDVTSHLPADNPSALDQAVAQVKDLDETPLILKGFPQEDDLALLLESLAALQAAIHKGPTLAKIVLACTTWVDFLSLSDGSLDHVRELAESDADRAEFTDMVRIAGDIASNIADGAIGQQKRNLLTVAQYALAWLAELIEKEEA